MDAYIESETEASGDGVSNLCETSAVDYRQRLINHIPDLRRYARSLTFSTDDADELLQNCLERALSRLHLLREDSSLKSWAFTIMHNIYCNWTRKMKRRPDHAPLDETSFAARVEAHQHASAELTVTIGMLGQLSERQREIIILIAIKGVSYREAAEKLDIPLGTVMSRLGRARERLRELVVNPPPATRPANSLHYKAIQQVSRDALKSSLPLRTAPLVLRSGQLVRVLEEFGRRASRDCSSTITGRGRCRPRCAASST
jgi:RNA polymerase sigma-70 factor, ECF subfamily